MSDTELLLKPKAAEQAGAVRRVEVFTGAGRRRRWSPEQKALIVSETYQAGETVRAVARRQGSRPSSYSLGGGKRRGREPAKAVWPLRRWSWKHLGRGPGSRSHRPLAGVRRGPRS
jgi:hypothetical protein